MLAIFGAGAFPGKPVHCQSSELSRSQDVSGRRAKKGGKPAKHRGCHSLLNESECPIPTQTCPRPPVLEDRRRRLTLCQREIRAIEITEMADPLDYRFGPFVFDARARVLYRDLQVVDLAPKAAELLALLLANAGAVLEKDALLDAVWAGRIVGESSLTRTMSILRTVLGKPESGDGYIDTISKRGYRFSAEVTSVIPTSLNDASIAVLPFNCYSACEDSEYFVDGLTEEITSELYKRGDGWLRVMARTTCMTFKNSLQRIGAIGRELGVDYVLEGSVRRHGEQLRIAAQLIRVKDEMHVWAENYERRLGNVLRLQCVVAGEIAREIRGKLAALGIGVCQS